MKANIKQKIFLGLALLFCSQHISAATEVEEIEVPVNEQELFISRYTAMGEHLIIWVAPGYGSHERSIAMAKQLAARDIEVWHVDLADSLFLPKNTSTMRTIDGSYVAGLIDAAYKQTGKTITLLTRSYGALPLLRGARVWQNNHQVDNADYLNGAILFSPEMYQTIPALGLPPVYADITYATNIPIMLYQAGNRGNRWQLEGLLENLELGGASVFVRVKQGVTGLFYTGDTSATTTATLKKLPDDIVNDLALLNKLPIPKRTTKLPTATHVNNLGLDTRLKAFKAGMEPWPLELISASDEKYIRKDYTGKVTLVNFWATWCPPCVEEIPSLNSLRKKMQGKPFELISVNYAEDEHRVKEFLKKVNVDFPVLLDETGRVSAQWNVLVYPATFVISPDGKITHGVNGAILWDSPEVVKQLNELMQIRNN